jgi:hypothetical protein
VLVLGPKTGLCITAVFTESVSRFKISDFALKLLVV